jgi:hypothetical protein
VILFYGEEKDLSMNKVLEAPIEKSNPLPHLKLVEENNKIQNKNFKSTNIFDIVEIAKR